MVVWRGCPGWGQVDEIRVGPGRASGGRVSRVVPRQSIVVHEGAGEAELGVAGDDEPGPPVGLFGGAHGWAGPARVFLTNR